MWAAAAWADGTADDDPIDVGRTCGSAMGTCTLKPLGDTVTLLNELESLTAGMVLAGTVQVRGVQLRSVHTSGPQTRSHSRC